MDARKTRIGEHAAEHALPWAINALGPVPADPADRRDWQQRASSIGAYRELSGYDHPADPIGSEPATAAPETRAAWREAAAALSPVDGPDVRGLPDGRLLHLRDTYPVETAWAPRYVTDELRQARAAAWEARLAGLRAAAEAAAARQRGDNGTATTKDELAASYEALHEAYRQRETVFAAVMADRDDWDLATRAQRHLAVAADTELRRRHPGQPFPPLRSAEPEPATETQRAELTHAPAEPPGEMGQLITDLAAAHRTFAERLADRQSLTILSLDPGYGDLGQAFPAWSRSGRMRSCSRPSRRSDPPGKHSNAPRTATPTGKLRTESGPARAERRRVMSHQPTSRCRAAISGMRAHVPDHGVRVAAHRVKLRVRVVLRDAPDAFALVPERRPG
jgi:hypothetical protein